jgi:hypothetical protein
LNGRSHDCVGLRQREYPHIDDAVYAKKEPLHAALFFAMQADYFAWVST